ncbi:hypothetical protein ACJX0J_036646, partial [Zea mays]
MAIDIYTDREHTLCNLYNIFFPTFKFIFYKIYPFQDGIPILVHMWPTYDRYYEANKCGFRRYILTFFHNANFGTSLSLKKNYLWICLEPFHGYRYLYLLE